MTGKRGHQYANFYLSYLCLFSIVNSHMKYRPSMTYSDMTALLHFNPGFTSLFVKSLISRIARVCLLSSEPYRNGKMFIVCISGLFRIADRCCSCGQLRVLRCSFCPDVHDFAELTLDQKHQPQQPRLKGSLHDLRKPTNVRYCGEKGDQQRAAC